MADRFTQNAAMRGNPRKIPRRVTLKTEDTPSEVLGEHRLRRSEKTLAPLAFAEHFNSIENLCLRNGRRKELACRLFLPNLLESGKRPSKQNAKSRAPPPPSNARDEPREPLSGPSFFRPTAES